MARGSAQQTDISPKIVSAPEKEKMRRVPKRAGEKIGALEVRRDVGGSA